MFTHQEIWIAIDNLAQQKGYSTSGLAKLAGLDPTALNRSKRQSPEGKPRWPSTESIAKILTVTDSNMREFTLLIEEPKPAPQPTATTHIPAMAYHHNLSAHHFDASGVPIGAQWSMADFGPNSMITVKPGCFILQISTHDFEPVYRKNAALLLTPGHAVEPGDKVLLCERSGSLAIMQLLQMTQNHVVLQPLTQDQPIRADKTSLTWMSRIAWASQ